MVFVFLSVIQTIEHDELSTGSHPESFRSVHGIETSYFSQILFHFKLRVIRNIGELQESRFHTTAFKKTIQQYS